VPSWDSLRAGAVVAERYQVIKPLARGGFGAVYVAEQLATERRVALKVLWPHVLENKRAREQFTLEARVASRIKSENVVQVLDAGVDTLNDVTYLVMELLEGRDLATLVSESGPPPPSAALEYLRQTAMGLDKAHRHVDRDGRPAPIIHRDLKPDNLFLTAREDGSPLLKILDFGIAKVLSQSTQMSGDVKGTPLYMAYEQAARGAIGPTTDIWAFGLIAFFLLSGKSYWKSGNSEDGTMTQLFAEVLSLPLTPPSMRGRELHAPLSLPPAFDAWFARCVHRDPAQRFQSIAETMRALLETGVGNVPAPSAASFAFAPAVTALETGVNGRHAAPDAVTLHEARTPAALQLTLPEAQLAPESAPKLPAPRRRAPLGLALLGAATIVGLAVWLGSKRAAPDNQVSGVPEVARAASVLVRPSDAPPAPPLPAADVAPSATAGTTASAASAAGVRNLAPPPARAPLPAARPAAPARRPAKKDDDVYGDR